MEMAKFGPGGNGEAFRKWGGRSTLDAPRFLRESGLDVYEYEAGQGISSTPEMLLRIGAAAKDAGIRMTFHAPYFISLSGVDPEKRLKSIDYIRSSLDAAALLGSGIIVVHTGSAAKISRAEAMRLAADTLEKTLESVDTHGVKIGLETMGKINQLGTLDEVITLCRMDPRLVPVVDFGHMNARERGGVFPDADAYLSVFDKIGDALGEDVAKNLHCHFSRIEYTDAGEQRHVTLADTAWGPEPAPFCEAIARRGLAPTVISESAGTQAEDAFFMKERYLAYLGA